MSNPEQLEDLPYYEPTKASRREGRKTKRNFNERDWDERKTRKRPPNGRRK